MIDSNSELRCLASRGNGGVGTTLSDLCWTLIILNAYWSIIAWLYFFISFHANKSWAMVSRKIGTNAWKCTKVDYDDVLVVQHDNVLVVSDDMMEYWCCANTRLSHPARTQLIYDHLEDSVFAPKACLTTSCTNMTCDGYHCYTSFPEDEFLSAESYFNDNLLSSVENAKLDRPLDSTPPLARSVFVAQEAYWGEPWGRDQAYSDDWYGED